MDRGKWRRCSWRQSLRLLLYVCLLLSGPVAAADSVETLVARAETLSGRAQVDALNDIAKAYWGVSTNGPVQWGSSSESLEESETDTNLRDTVLR